MTVYGWLVPRDPVSRRGRSAFARNEIVSSDALRATVGTGEADLDASRDAFAVLDSSSQRGFDADSPR